MKCTGESRKTKRMKHERNEATGQLTNVFSELLRRNLDFIAQEILNNLDAKDILNLILAGRISSEWMRILTRLFNSRKWKNLCSASKVNATSKLQRRWLRFFWRRNQEIKPLSWRIDISQMKRHCLSTDGSGRSVYCDDLSLALCSDESLDWRVSSISVNEDLIAISMTAFWPLCFFCIHLYDRWTFKRITAYSVKGCFKEIQLPNTCYNGLLVCYEQSVNSDIIVAAWNLNSSQMCKFITNAINSDDQIFCVSDGILIHVRNADCSRQEIPHMTIYNMKHWGVVFTIDGTFGFQRYVSSNNQLDCFGLMGCENGQFACSVFVFKTNSSGGLDLYCYSLHNGPTASKAPAAFLYGQTFEEQNRTVPEYFLIISNPIRGRIEVTSIINGHIVHSFSRGPLSDDVQFDIFNVSHVALKSGILYATDKDNHIAIWILPINYLDLWRKCLNGGQPVGSTSVSRVISAPPWSGYGFNDVITYIDNCGLSQSCIHSGSRKTNVRMLSWPI